MSRFGWWLDAPIEAHIRLALEDRPRKALNSDRFFVLTYTAPEIAWMVEHGLICDGWPLEFTERGRRYYRAGSTPPPRNNKAWRPACDDTSSSPSVQP